jgi:capsular polysaccharide biosynthesis protein
VKFHLRDPGFVSVASVFELLDAPGNAQWTFHPPVHAMPEPFCFADGGDRERLREYAAAMGALSLFSVADASVLACGIVADARGRVVPAETLGADEVLEPAHRSQLKWGAMTVDREAGFVQPRPELGVKSLPGTTLVLAQGGIRTYGHWLLDVVPKLGLLDLLPRDVRLLLPGPLRPWQAETLRLFGVPAERLELYDPATTLLRCERALLLSHLRYYYAMSTLANIGFERLRAAVAGAGNDARPHRRLLVVRGQNARDRQSLRNMDEIRSLCFARGFEELEPGSLTLAQQIELFSEAECIVGEQGSALHNAVFAPRGARVLCLHSRDAQFFAQSGIGMIRGQPTGYVFGEPLGVPDPDWPNRVFTVRPETVVRALDQLDL